jgi:hypothetical protein
MSLNLIQRIDRAICAYLGLEKDETVKPESVQLNGDKLSVLATIMPFRRFIYARKWQTFAENELKQVNKVDENKLGVAIGKTLADNLVVSFDAPELKEEKQ